MTSPGSWSYGIKAEVLQNAAQGNRELRFLILSAIQRVKTNKGLNKSLASDGGRAERRLMSSVSMFVILRVRDSAAQRDSLETPK